MLIRKVELEDGTVKQIELIHTVTDEPPEDFKTAIRRFLKARNMSYQQFFDALEEFSSSMCRISMV